jgi:hypothetical protein
MTSFEQGREIGLKFTERLNERLATIGLSKNDLQLVRDFWEAIALNVLTYGMHAEDKKRFAEGIQAVLARYAELIEQTRDL